MVIELVNIGNQIEPRWRLRINGVTVAGSKGSKALDLLKLKDELEDAEDGERKARALLEAVNRINREGWFKCFILLHLVLSQPPTAK